MGICHPLRGTAALGCGAGAPSFIPFKYFLSITTNAPALWHAPFCPISALAPACEILLVGLSMSSRHPRPTVSEARAALKPLPQEQPGSPLPAPTPLGECQHPLGDSAHAQVTSQSHCHVGGHRRPTTGAWEVTHQRFPGCFQQQNPIFRQILPGNLIVKHENEAALWGGGRARPPGLHLGASPPTTLFS